MGKILLTVFIYYKFVCLSGRVSCGDARVEKTRVVCCVGHKQSAGSDIRWLLPRPISAITGLFQTKRASSYVCIRLRIELGTNNNSSSRFPGRGGGGCCPWRIIRPVSISMVRRDMMISVEKEAVDGRRRSFNCCPFAALSARFLPE